MRCEGFPHPQRDQLGTDRRQAEQFAKPGQRLQFLVIDFAVIADQVAQVES
jgi:hypothetical protein